MAKTYRTIPPLTQQDTQRFWSKIDKTPGQGPRGDCWIWTGSKRTEYGLFSLRAYRGSRLNYEATRVMYLLTHGNLDATLDICHDCDNPPCVNPAHLWAGTASDNLLDCSRKNRMPKEAPWRRGELNPLAKLTDEQVRDVRRARERGERVTDIAAKYGVHQSTISKIIHRQRFRSIK